MKYCDSVVCTEDTPYAKLNRILVHMKSPHKGMQYPNDTGK